MALKTWPQLATNECVAHAEVLDAVDRGDLHWRGLPPEWPYPPAQADRYCYTRADFEAFVWSSSMANSGIAPNELMSKAEMLAYATAPVAPVPGSFSAIHDMSSCPQRRVVLSWTADASLGTLVLDHRHPVSGWYTVANLAAGVQGYVHPHPSPHEGRNDYRIRYTSQSEYAHTFAHVLCVT